MASRTEFHEKLCELLGSSNVYFKPPASVKMNYPAVRYSLSGIDHKRANDRIYRNTNQYEVIVIDYDPESRITKSILENFQMCRFDRNYASDNLNHDVLTIYY